MKSVKKPLYHKRNAILSCNSDNAKNNVYNQYYVKVLLMYYRLSMLLLLLVLLPYVYLKSAIISSKIEKVTTYKCESMKIVTTCEFIVKIREKLRYLLLKSIKRKYINN